MQKPTFVSIIILFECLVSIICSGYALWIFSRVLWTSFNSKTIRLNWPLKIYAILQVLLALTTIAYLSFLVLFWRIQNSAYDLYWLYFTGGIQNCVLMILALAVSALGIDRCLLVKFPTKHLTMIPMIVFVVMTAIWIAINVVLRMIPAYPQNTVDKKDCENVGCLGSFYTNIVYYSLRFTASGLNFAVGIILTLLLRQMPIISNYTIKSSRLVLYAIVTTLSFDLLPHFVSIVVYRVFQINFADYVGPYSTIFGAIENAICAFFYRRTFKVGATTSHDTLTVPHHSHPSHSTPIVMMQKPISVSFAILSEYLIALICCCYTLFIFTGMLFASLQSKSTKFNWPLKIYAIHQIIISVLTIVYLLYLSVFWRPQDPVYNVYCLYFFGGIQNSFHIVSSLAVCALGIDRCLIVKFPTKNLNFIPLMAFILMTFIWMSINITTRMIPVYPRNAIDKKDCENFGCLGSYTTNIIYYTLRFAASGINFVVGIILTVLLKRMTIVSPHTVKSSRTALYAIITTLSFDLVPHLTSIVIYNQFQINFGDYAGPYSTIFGAIENTICAFFYRNTFSFKFGRVIGQTTSTIPQQITTAPVVMIHNLHSSSKDVVSHQHSTHEALMTRKLVQRRHS